MLVMFPRSPCRDIVCPMWVLTITPTVLRAKVLFESVVVTDGTVKSLPLLVRRTVMGVPVSSVVGMLAPPTTVLSAAAVVTAD